MRPKLIFAINIALFWGTTQAAEWTYGGHTGPSHWKDHYPKCGGLNQSPIDLPVDSSLTYDSSLGNFNFTGYRNMTTNPPILSNNGHSVQLSINSTSIGNTYMTGGGLQGKYIAIQLHFHWGPASNNGSEHTFRGHEFPLELHIVHVKEGLTVEAAKNVTDGLAVLGIFFVVDPNGHNSDIQPLVEALSNITYYGRSRPLSLDFSCLMPHHVTEFYRYMGSLTTPTCDEAVLWTLFEDKITISEAQMRQFRALYNTNENETEHMMPLEMNFRPVQPRYNRTVMKSFDTSVPASFHWGYHGYEGPKNWPLYYPECGNSSQSPINIPDPDVPDMVFDSSMGLDTLTFNNYDQAFIGNMSNNGHSLQIDIDPSANLFIKNGGLAGTFRAAHFHFHWGSSLHNGSEHTIKEQSYPMEMHIVHYNDKYGGIAEAASKQDGLAVVGFFVNGSEENNTYFSTIVRALEHVKYRNSPKYEINDLRLTYITNKDLRLNDTHGKHLTFYRYKGSLTTPGCAETVTWTVMEPTINMGTSQIAAFRDLAYKTKGTITDKDKISENYRPVQPLNSRNVYMSLNKKTTSRVTTAAKPTGGYAAATSGEALLLVPIVAIWVFTM
ncbi:carbonic anhydrase 9-like [Dreissena polymorpha]|uniref:Carbonic anhydrase n=1 Tax=Dreissena polymorpha TaxID=45954 RepID=A0A9D4R8Z4_DREPO|nr:carbonic anhydrase 9-like [Dreissena polymorpha]KAH3857640.1 hypothetical protein DPMN_100251 [Dreissena polymorpha]